MSQRAEKSKLDPSVPKEIHQPAASTHITQPSSPTFRAPAGGLLVPIRGALHKNLGVGKGMKRLKLEYEGAPGWCTWEA